MPRQPRRNLRSLIWRESVPEEVSEELSFHVEMRARELAAARGLGIEEARRVAVGRFGDLSHVQAECEEIAGRRDRDMKRTAFWSEFWHDARFALHQIRSAPGFYLLVIGTLALGIGPTTTIFSAVNAVVLRPLAFTNSERIFFISESWKESRGDASAGTFVDLRAEAKQFTQIAAIDWGNYVLSPGDMAHRVLGAAVTHNYFGVYSVQPVLGRGFTSEDEQAGAPRVVILSHAAFEGRFQSDPAALGRDIRVNGEPARIIGILPAGFDPNLAAEELWVPLTLTNEQISARGSRWLHLVGLGRSGIPAASLQGELDQIGQTLARRYPAEFQDRTIEAQPIRDVLIGDNGRLLLLLMGAVLVVLLIACANAANLLLARGAAREKEIAIRGALGAGRARILRQLLTENLVLALVTVAVSLVLALFAIKLIVAMAPADIPRIAATSIDPVVLAFALLLAIVSSMLFGLVPALRVLNTDLQTTLRTGGRDTRGPVRDWLRSALVGGEVALSMLLLIGAGLLIRTSIEVARVDTGFRMDGIVSARVTLPEQSYGDPARVRRAFEDMVERIESTPGIAAAAAGSLPPLGSGGNEMFMNPEGKPLTSDQAIVGRMRIVTADYLNAMRIGLVRGRHFDARDVPGAGRVTIVSEELAQKLWPNEDPLGKRVACCEGDASNPVYKTVIGVARGVRSIGPTQVPDPEFYIPISQAPDDSWNWIQRSMSLVATGEVGTESLVNAVRTAVHGVDRTVPVYGVSTLRDALRASTAPARFNTMMLSLLGGLGLLLAATGIYGVVSYFVNLRRQEIGVRIALGASERSVLALMTRQAMVPIGAGLLIGAAAALAATRLLAALLFGVTATDPLTFAIVIIGLFAVALIAILIPARRASRVHPTEALLG